MWQLPWVLLGLLSSALAQSTTASASAATYTNPILDAVGADPWVIRVGDYYYMTYTETANITMLRSQDLTEWDNAEQKLVLNPPMGTNYSYDLWAPELHTFNGLWYIIFTADVDADSPPPTIDMLCDFSCPAVNHRMFVLESSGPDPWESDYTMKAELNTFDQFAIDGTYFQYNGNLYHVYSCWYSAYQSWPANLCITQMSNPWTVSSTLAERAIISTPDQPWEKTPYNRTINVRLSTNEGPEQLTNPTTNQTFIIYSAARSDNPDYCLGQLELVGTDPMNPAHWQKYTPYCVFYQNPADSVYGVGHASFTTSPDGTQDWIVYHGMLNYENGWADRTIRTQQFSWNADGSPNFPRPGYGPYEVPSGQDGSGQSSNSSSSSSASSGSAASGSGSGSAAASTASPASASASASAASGTTAPEWPATTAMTTSVVAGPSSWIAPGGSWHSYGTHTITW